MYNDKIGTKRPAINRDTAAAPPRHERSVKKRPRENTVPNKNIEEKYISRKKVNKR